MTRRALISSLQPPNIKHFPDGCLSFQHQHIYGQYRWVSYASRPYMQILYREKRAIIARKSYTKLRRSSSCLNVHTQPCCCKDDRIWNHIACSMFLSPPRPLTSTISPYDGETDHQYIPDFAPALTKGTCCMQFIVPA